MLSFERTIDGRSDRVETAIHTLVVAGWTGRDEAALQRHIEELAAIGVPRPSSVPVFYRWIGLGSDHTDRKAESLGIALSKQLCAKVVGRMLWRLDEISDRWDRLMLRSFATIAGKRVLYQEGPLAAMRTPADLLARWQGEEHAPGTIMFCGTLGAIGGIRPASRFEMELEDPPRGRSMRHGYEIRALPVVS